MGIFTHWMKYKKRQVKKDFEDMLYAAKSNWRTAVSIIGTVSFATVMGLAGISSWNQNAEQPKTNERENVSSFVMPAPDLKDFLGTQQPKKEEKTNSINLNSEKQRAKMRKSLYLEKSFDSANNLSMKEDGDYFVLSLPIEQGEQFINARDENGKQAWVYYSGSDGKIKIPKSKMNSSYTLRVGVSNNKKPVASVVVNYTSSGEPTETNNSVGKVSRLETSVSKKEVEGDSLETKIGDEPILFASLGGSNFSSNIYEELKNSMGVNSGSSEEQIESRIEDSLDWFTSNYHGAAHKLTNEYVAVDSTKKVYDSLALAVQRGKKITIENNKITKDGKAYYNNSFAVRLYGEKVCKMFVHGKSFEEIKQYITNESRKHFRDKNGEKVSMNFTKDKLSKLVGESLKSGFAWEKGTNIEYGNRMDSLCSTNGIDRYFIDCGEGAIQTVYVSGK